MVQVRQRLAVIVVRFFLCGKEACMSSLKRSKEVKSMKYLIFSCYVVHTAKKKIKKKLLFLLP